VPPTDASTDADPFPVRPDRADSGGDGEDTLDLRLPEELVALFAVEPGDAPARAAVGRHAAAGEQRSSPSPTQVAPGVTTDAGRHVGRLDAEASYQTEIDSSTVAGARSRPGTDFRSNSAAHTALFPIADDDLLDHVAAWGVTATPAGRFRLVPVRLDHDLAIVSRWMNDPAVAAFWELAGSPDRTEAHLRAQLTGDGRSVPCLGMLDDTPMSYWEIYRADLDPLARHYPVRPHDTGIHLLVGGVADRGRGLGSALLRAVSDLVLDRRPACARVVAEPDLRNTPSIAAFLTAGFRFAGEVDLPAKRAALMMRDRSLRDVV
jgi:RimJ/RimL family protein N-acetyltransferase